MQIKELTSEEFYPLFMKWRPVVFADTMYFNARDVRTPHEISQFEFLKSGVKDLYSLNLVMYEGEELVGWSTSMQVSAGELYMMNSAIFPKFRRQGLYKKLMAAVVDKAKELGFQVVTSQHVISNNDVIIPKLKFGFHILGTETTDQYGALVKLGYFINEMRRDMYYFRAGTKWPTPEMEAVLAKSKL